MVNKAPQNNTWYVAIIHGAAGYSSFVAAGGGDYPDFEKRAPRQGIKVIAQRFDVTDPVINRLTGFNAAGQRTEVIPLKTLVDRLNAGEQFDIQAALDSLCVA